MTSAIGNCAAYSVQSGRLRSFTMDGLGTMAFHRGRDGLIYAIGDPLTDHGKHQAVIDGFLDAFPRSIFIQCSDITARHLRAKNYYANIYGIETELPLPHWRCQGRKSHMLRKQRKKSERAGIIIREIGDNPEDLAEARRISDQWLAEKKSTAVELEMLTRPPVFAPEQGTRKFAAYHDHDMVGIAFFDPLSITDPNKGYVFQIVRTLSLFSGTGSHLLLHAADVFREEGMETLSLGGSPLALRPEPMKKNSPITRLMLHIFKFTSKHAYDYEGLEFYKSRFNGAEKPIYFCTPHWLPVRGLIGLAVETGMARHQLSYLRSRLTLRLKRMLPRSGRR